MSFPTYVEPISDDMARQLLGDEFKLSSKYFLVSTESGFYVEEKYPDDYTWEQDGVIRTGGSRDIAIEEHQETVTEECVQHRVVTRNKTVGWGLLVTIIMIVGIVAAGCILLIMLL